MRIVKAVVLAAGLIGFSTGAALACGAHKGKSAQSNKPATQQTVVTSDEKKR